jgi:capsular exopolysaccharide synthesis family protein
MSDVSDLNRHTEAASTTSVAPVALEPSSYEAPGILYAGDDRGGGLFMEYFRTLSRHRWLIVLFAIMGVLGSFLFNFTALPVYRARTSLDIQSINNGFMNMKDISPTDIAMDPTSDEYVQTQIKLLQSDTLMQRTIDHLKAEPHPDFIDQMDLASRIERATYLVPYKRIPYDDLVDDAAHHITVKPLGMTRLVEITCDSWSPDFSAKFCNTLVDQFREGDLETRGAESQRTSEWLTKQVADVKAKAEESQRKLEEATGGNGMILSQESTGVEEDRLRDMQSEYVKAEADRMEKAAAAGIGSSSTAGMAPDLSQSAAYKHYEQELADLQGQIAKLVPPLTEEAPAVIHLRSQIKATQAAMETERAANAGHLQSDYQAALHREQMLAGAYHAEEGRVSSDLGKASKVALLRGEVESEQKLYQTLLQMAREAGFASAIHASTVRVVDAAVPLTTPFSPRRSSAAASGLMLGTLVGVCMAFFIERSTTVFRVPGDTERYLGLRELGVIPSSLRGRKAIAALPASDAGGAQVLTPRETQLTLSNWTDNFSIVAEAYRSATTSIMLSEHPREQGRIYVLSSPNASEGKTTVVSNLGVALSKSRLRVLLVDGDLRKPALHKVLQVPNEFGLRNLLRGETVPKPEAEEASAPPCYQSTTLANLFVLPAGQGTEETVELLHSANTGDILKRLRGEFDVIIIDTPPMLHMADTRVLASHANGAILVVRAGITTRDEAAKARDLFDQDRVRVVGTILNDFNPDRNGLPNYYKSYYRYMEEVTTAANGTFSWLDGLLSKDRGGGRRRGSRNGSVNGASGFEGPTTFDAAEAFGGATPFDEADAFDFRDVTAAARAHAVQYGSTNGAANGAGGAGGALVRVNKASLMGPVSAAPTPEHLDGVVSQLFSKMFNREQVEIGPMEIGTLGDSLSSLYTERTEDRRRTKRKEYPPLVAYYWDGGSPRAHDIKDISSTGFYLFTEERWYPGTQVMILLQRPGEAGNDPERSITVNAMVVRFGIDGIGFAFIMPEKSSARGTDGPSGADYATFRRFLQQLPEDEA